MLATAGSWQGHGQVGHEQIGFTQRQQLASPTKAPGGSITLSRDGTIRYLGSSLQQV
jgi:hypothetical protein